MQNSYVDFLGGFMTPPMETPDPPNDTPGASKQVVLTPNDIPRILRVGDFLFQRILGDLMGWTSPFLQSHLGEDFFGNTFSNHLSQQI